MLAKRIIPCLDVRDGNLNLRTTMFHECYMSTVDLTVSKASGANQVTA